MLISLGTSKASEARGHFGSAWGRLGKAFSLTGRGKRRSRASPRSFEIAFCSTGRGNSPSRACPESHPLQVYAESIASAWLFPVLEARRSPKENSSMLIGFGVFQSLGSPRPLRKRLGETWEGFFPGQAGVKGHRKRATWGPNVYFPRACRGQVLFFACPALSCGLYKGLSGFGSSPKSKGKQSDFDRFGSFSKPGKPEGTSEALGGDLGRPFP